MSIKAPKVEKTFAVAPEGNHIARVCQVVQIGTLQETNVKGEVVQRAKVRVAFELPTELHVFKEERGEEPFMIGDRYTLSFYSGSNLRKLVEGIVGKMEDDEADEFDVSTLIGKECMVNVGHYVSKKGYTNAKILSAAPLPKGITAPEAIIKPVLLSYDDWNEDVFESLPEFIRSEIESTPEYAMLRGHAPVTKDDIPFN